MHFLPFLLNFWYCISHCSEFSMIINLNLQISKQCCTFHLRSAIRDMVVRGAPAIAIAAALSLAAEVFNLETFNGTSDDAAIFLCKKLEYLVSRFFLLLNLVLCYLMKQHSCIWFLFELLRCAYLILNLMPCLSYRDGN